jgi:hypothetical protein
MSVKEVVMIIIVVTLLKLIHVLLPFINKRWIQPSIVHIRHYIYQTAAYWAFVSIMVPLTIIQMILDDGGPPPYIPKSQRWKTKLRRWGIKVKEKCRAAPAQILDASLTWWKVWWKQKTNIEFPVTGSIKQVCGMMAICCMMATNRRPHVTPKTERAFEANIYDIAIDSACSYCITNDMQHFVGDIEQVNVAVKGIGGKVVSATLKGTVKWSFANDEGIVHDEYIPNTYYNAESPYCLYSPQHVAQSTNDHHPERNGTYCVTYADTLELHWNQRTQKRTVRIDPSTNIFVMQSAPTYEPHHGRFTAFNHAIEEIDGDQYTMTTKNMICMMSNVIPPDDDESISEGYTGDAIEPVRNMEPSQERYHPDLPNTVFDTPDPNEATHYIHPEDTDIQANTSQAQLLAWHYRLGHIPFGKIRQFAARGDLPADLATCPTPRCAACMFGKMTRRAWRTRAPVNAMTIPPVTVPGSVVSMDQLVSAVPGLIGQMKGFLTHKRYTVATIFVDHFSGLSFVHLQKGATAEETIEGKRAFENYARTHGVHVKHYHADNGIFEAKEFQMAVSNDGQSISYCGVNAHHQNGRAEKKIRDLQELARTMMLHAQHRWPNAINTHLWPFAIKLANDLSNRSPAIQSGISPLELFSQVDIAPKVKHSHTFGAPVYVLENALQTPGSGIPKWKSRSNMGIYVGTSPRHSRKIALVLNLVTGHVSPQFHVVVDDFFETLRPSTGNAIPKSDWQKMTGFVKGADVGQRRGIHTSEQAQIPTTEQEPWPDVTEVTDISPPTRDEGRSMQVYENYDGESSTTDTETPITDPLPEIRNVEQSRATRSGRIPKQTSRMRESIEQQHAGIVALHVEWEVFHDDTYLIQDRMEQPLAFVASTNPDVVYMDQAMKEPDSKQFHDAMLKEVKAHTDNGHWTIVRRDTVPDGVEVLPAVWAMRRKRRILTGEPYKWKARLNVHGGKQVHGVNYWETYAPVIAWTTIRLYLIMALLNKKKTRQIDFVLAYPQADIECDLYMEIPRGFEFQGSRKTHCLLLKKNLYGQKQAGRVWNEYLHDGLLARGFEQSAVDMCLYYHAQYKVNLLIYTDDGILIGNEDSDIDAVIALLREPTKETRAFNMTDEGNLNDYLGVKVEYLPNGTIKLSQPHLIQQVIDDLGFNDRTGGKATPAASTIKLHRDLHGEERREDWHYRSVIGKLNFIEKSTRPDIAYAVHQCARFSNDPKLSHENAVKRIVKYLITTKDQGIYLQPDKHSFDCWVDADFVGNWDRVNDDIDPSTAKSRTGYIINYGGCPISWASKLQTDVALSTTEAEYNALSTSLREVIHLMQLVEEAKEKGWDTYTGVPQVHCKVFEDNIGALEMANLPKMRPRTKHLCTRLHHFRERVRKGLISVHHVATDLQIADLLTKPQPEPLFVRQRAILLRWPNSQLSPGLPDHLRACDILPRGASETQVNTAGQHPETNEGNEVSLSHASQERWEMPKVCPSTLHDNGQELQETNLSATTMTALLSTDVQTYDAWTLIQHRNGKGGTNQALNGPKEGPKKSPKLGPKLAKQNSLSKE